MSHWKSAAICLRVLDYGETSQIATFLTAARGKVSAIAKGSRRRGSVMFGELNPLGCYEIVCIARRKSPLHTLTELQPTETYRGARLELSRLHAALYVLEFAREATVEGVAQPRVYALVERALQRVSRNLTYNPLTLMIFELLVLEALGFGVRLDACAECGVGLESDNLRLAPSLGGTCCGGCASHCETLGD